MGKILELTQQQEELKHQLELQLRVFYSREWETPRFPWPLIVSNAGNGVQTVIKKSFPKYAIIDTMQWNVLGGKGTPTIHALAELAQKRTLILLRNIHTLYAVSTETQWYKTVLSEIYNVLGGSLSDCLEHDKLKLITRNLFFCGTGNWAVDSKGQLDLESNQFTKVDFDPSEVSGLQTFLQRFHSSPLVLSKPTSHEWTKVIHHNVDKANPYRVQKIAEDRSFKDENFSKLGEVVHDYLMDSPVPELEELLNTPENGTNEDTNAEVNQPAHNNEKFIRSRVRLLLCKLYGETNVAEVKNHLNRALKHLEHQAGVQSGAKELGRLSGRLNRGEFKSLAEDVREYLVRQIDTAKAIITQGTIEC